MGSKLKPGVYETIYGNETYIEKSKKSVKVDESLSQLEQENYVADKF